MNYTTDNGLQTETEIQQWVQQISNKLDTDGYTVVRQPLSETDFNRISAGLGAIMSRSHLVVDPEKDAAQEAKRIMVGKEKTRPSIYRSAGLDFHNDNPCDNLISWYCIEQDDTSGSLLLIDSHELLEGFSSEELKLLETVRVRYIVHHDGVEQHPTEALLAWKGSEPEVYFAGWHLEGEYTDAQRKVIDKFKANLEARKKAGPIKNRLEPGQSIYVNNRRMLHGRGPIEANSRRHIIRLTMQSS